MENSIFDGCETPATIATERDRLVALAVSRGGNETKIRTNFKTLWEGA